MIRGAARELVERWRTAVDEFVADGFVVGVTLRSNEHAWTFSSGHSDFKRPETPVPGHVAKPIELHRPLSVGDEVLMPSHPFENATSAQDPETDN